MRNRAQRGQVMPLIALGLTVMLGFGGLGVDVGSWEYHQREQQSAADAAALGGAQQLIYSNCTNYSAATTAAQNDAANGGFPAGGNVALTIQAPPQSGPFAGNGCAVYVRVTSNHVASYFAKLFGIGNGVSESTQAIAAVAGAGRNTPCIFLLSPTAQANFNGAHVNSPGCGIAINDTANFNGASISAPSIGYAGAAPNENGSTFGMASPSRMLPVSDPCPEIAGCAYTAANPPSSNACTSFNGNGYSGTLSAGCYSSLNLNGANVTLQSGGTYVLSGSSNFNGAHVTGTNVTIFVTATGTAPNFNGATVNLSAPTTGNLAHVLYYQVPSNTTSANFNGSNNLYNGLIYCPGATSVNFNGAHGGYVVLVFGSTNFNGSGAVDFATPPPGGAIMKQVVLGE
jgi:Flp pilus assembly protein TadG